MEGNDRNVIKISSLEEALQQFNMPHLLKELDENLELVRKNKEETEEKHKTYKTYLKSIDNELLKLSKIYHPDKAIQGNKSVDGVTNAENMQIALNATRKVLKTLTEVFLKDIDIHYKYEFFSKLDINTLINEEQIDLEINNVLCKISHLSEIKRVNIVGEIRNFLLKCKNCFESFFQDKKFDFVSHRDNAFHHLQKCIEGYEILLKECNLIDEECITEEDENTRRAIKKIKDQCQREYNILKKIEETAKQSLQGTFKIFPIHEAWCCNESMKSMVLKELEYHVLPFIFYVNVLLMCSVMLYKKSVWMKLKAKIEGTLDYIIGGESVALTSILKEPLLLKAYCLASYSNNKNYCKEETEKILKEKGHFTVDSSNIREAFNQILKKIEQLLAKRFDIDSYKEGKSNREQFNERLLELNDSVNEFKEEGKNLLEKFKLYEQETKEIRKKYSKLCEKVEKTEEEFRKNIPKCENSTENINKMIHNQNKLPGYAMINLNNAHENESYANAKYNFSENKSMKDIEEHGGKEEHERKLKESETILNMSICNENVSNSISHHSSSSYEVGCNSITEGEDKKYSEQNLQSIPTLEASNNTAMSFENTVQNSQASNPVPCISANENVPCDKTSREVDDEEIPCFNITTSKEVQQNIAPQKQFPKCTSDDGTTNQISHQCVPSCVRDSKVDIEGISCFKRDQLQKEPINFQIPELVSKESDSDLQKYPQNCEGHENVKSNKVVKGVTNEHDEDPSYGWEWIY